LTQKPPDQPGSRRCPCGGSNDSCYRCFGKGVEIDSSFRPLAPSRSWNKSPRDASLLPSLPPPPKHPVAARHLVLRRRKVPPTASLNGVPSAKAPVDREWVICEYCGVRLKSSRRRRHLRWVHPQKVRSRLKRKPPKSARNTPKRPELSACPICRLRMPRIKLAEHIGRKHPGR
jgi:hypothetical protein